MLHRIRHLLEAALAVFCAVGLFLMMCLTAVDVIGRYGFHKSVFGSAEYTEILMVGIIFAGLALVTAKNEHITVTIFEGPLQRYAPGMQNWVVHVFTLAVYTLIAFQLYRTGRNSLESGKLTAVVSLPQWIVPMGAALLSMLGVILFAISIIILRRRITAARTVIVPGGPDDDRNPGNE